MAKRERLDIINDILRVVNTVGEVRPTPLMRKSNLSPQMFKEYVEELVSKGFITEHEEDHTYYTINRKGLEFLAEYRRIQDFIKDFGL